MKVFLFLPIFFLPSCATYNKSVASRQVGIAGNTSGAKVFYKIEYR